MIPWYGWYFGLLYFGIRSERMIHHPKECWEEIFSLWKFTLKQTTLKVLATEELCVSLELLRIKIPDWTHFWCNSKLREVISSPGLTTASQFFGQTHSVIPCLSIRHSWPNPQLNKLHWLRPEMLKYVFVFLQWLHWCILGLLFNKLYSHHSINISTPFLPPPPL